MKHLWDRPRAALGRASAAFRAASRRTHILTVLTCMVAGFMIVTSALASRGTDLRPNRNTELAGLVRAEAGRNEALARTLAGLRTEVDALAKQEVPAQVADDTEAARQAAMVPVEGPAVAVTLTDAPLSVRPEGVDEDLLVVHQQDIQAVANALWAGGAEAMTIQGQRISSRTGIKCVGNTVVLDSVPYAPPYVIVAIGDVAQLEAALESSTYLRTYRDYVDAYRLGWAVERRPVVTMPGYRGSIDLQYARAVS